jgi:hypothetical protein
LRRDRGIPSLSIVEVANPLVSLKKTLVNYLLRITRPFLAACPLPRQLLPPVS